MKANILVVDDEESLRFTFENFLSGEGHRVQTAAGYDDAIALIKETVFDLIFADILLGSKTGIDVLRKAREMGHDCPVVMITGEPNVETASEAVRLGAFDYIAKPVRQESLLKLMEQGLRHRRVTLEKEGYRARLEAIFRSVKDAVISVDEDLMVTEVNEAAWTVCGFNRKECIGKNFESLAKRCDGRCVEAIKDTVVNKKPNELYRAECTREGGGQHVVTISTAPLLYGHGSSSGAVMVIRDETRLARMEKDLGSWRAFHHIIGGSERMQEVFALIRDLANVPTTVLIKGESGTGKELVADALHFGGIRKNKPLVKVNCSALPEGLLESELFGHVRGAFTGAIKDKVGRFEQANGGTIFLDEIGDISPRLQLRLLRVLQEREFERVGSSRLIKVDVRVVAATNQNLREKVRAGEFREDLMYRLNVVELDIPPLRERLEDIPLLVPAFLEKFSHKLQKEIRGTSADVDRILMEYTWPGNVRELENVLEHACVKTRESIISVGCLPPELRTAAITQASSRMEGNVLSAEAITQALNKSGWNKAKAARLLGVSRQTIYRKIHECNISEARKP